jgi:3-phenylpropionate/cinnamic acid dioxygenase small subunit
MTWMDPDKASRIATIADRLYAEGHALDMRQWDDWLSFYAADCEYWVPAWKNEHELTDDPQTEISLIYYAARAGLEDRVWRVKSGLSAASALLPRTQHSVSDLVLVSEAGATDGETVDVRYNWCVNQFEPDTRATHCFFGRVEATLIHRDGAWRFRRKKTVLLNDYIPTVVDFYSL